MRTTPTIRVQTEDFDSAREEALLTVGRRDAGAVVAFTGLCRDEDGTLAALELEHYPGMAEEEILRVANDALSRWLLAGLTIIHRYGVIRPGERIVLVMAAARHRGDAFAAAEFLMDYLKTRAPFWKKERRIDGSDGGWVAAKSEDDAAASRWEH
jgi:molybdopterin synthase catalytic subunit